LYKLLLQLQSLLLTTISAYIYRTGPREIVVQTRNEEESTTIESKESEEVEEDDVFKRLHEEDAL
jgi:hypothetical protein